MGRMNWREVTFLRQQNVITGRAIIPLQINILKRQPCLDTNNAEAFNYFADNLFLLSYLNDPPYNDERLVAKAFETWQRSPGKEVKTKNDAWHYIVVARIHEVKYKFETINYYEQYWYAVLYAERALVHNPGDYYPWTYLGRFHRNIELEANSMADFDIAESLKPR
jgi:hypothetical protein